jgi:hypothetical protein
VTQIFIVSGTSQTSPADWNNSNNTVEGIGGGGLRWSKIKLSGSRDWRWWWRMAKDNKLFGRNARHNCIQLCDWRRRHRRGHGGIGRKW